MAVKVPDPYEALGLPHDASLAQIKLAYRKLALEYHPDQMTRRNASGEETKFASDRFAAISAAYQLLSDPRKKIEYDHIHKYGGYDDDKDPASTNNNSNDNSKQQDKENPFSSSRTSNNGKRARNTGIGYNIVDPFSYVLSGGQRRKAASAGIQIPRRVHFSREGGGVRFAFSNSQYETTKSGSKKFVSKTTQIVGGKKFTKVETTTVHPDGRKEVVIEGDDYIERRETRIPTRRKSAPDLRQSAFGVDVTQTEDNQMPWYMNAWQGFRDKMSQCHNPCGMTIVQ
mmetsp:Transcript_26961/g.41323  ORF Transcript_26961/g.41323 Transcript_26961/m.41323 type:complete len:285 (-) Transcript_26961:106-960(-)|eukprot:CAMPEP_0195303092 /NCGR_PEP_ID=MMETSP0707-20130614/32227_1 /TAXON_ID=33640 /ORGANISM="Asterionellopsis glacialis, Strain CCMP134" /LENGTH=284 /DNA_ID=CAMNT_0040366541 /DNA_START=100 /DNA_END=954 /DNA_ORIENTATION=-